MSANRFPITALADRGVPIPWDEGDNIPWNEPGFSRRMLREHLSQEHDAASRRFDIIDRHAAAIHALLPQDRPARVLDLGCGPGLYAVRLARMGHTVRGLDFSPASIAYARGLAAPPGPACAFELADLREADFTDPGGIGYDLVMFLYGEFNVFRPAHARRLLEKAQAALRPGGLLLLEVSTPADVRRMGQQPAGWSAQPEGLFSDAPHLLLFEAFWDAPAQVATNRYWLLDLQSGGLERYAASYQSYAPRKLAGLLREAGFVDPRAAFALEGPFACIREDEGSGEQEPGEDHKFVFVLAARPGAGHPPKVED